jgi:hypothetical protein
VERLGLSVMNTNVLPFTASSLDITIMAMVSQLDQPLSLCLPCMLLSSSAHTLSHSSRDANSSGDFLAGW